MTKFPALIIALAIAAQVQAVPSDTCNPNTWVTNGPVNAIAPAGNKVYIGGSFTTVGPYTGGGIPFNSSTGDPAPAFPKINGNVWSACADGNGGWFVGGIFTSIGGVTRHNVAHILTSGIVDPAWNPDADSGVFSLAVGGTTVFTGGKFTSIGGKSRNGIAALGATTGNALAWNPNANITNNPFANYGVLSLVVSGTTVYAGGSFTSIGGQSRNNIAALDATTGNATAWDPNAYSDVYAIAVSGTTVYAGGKFWNIGGQNRSHIAALDATTGNALAWNPSAGFYSSYDDPPYPEPWVFSLAVSGTIVYAGGIFTSIGGQSRNNIAALDATTGNALPWNPNANGYDGVYALALIGTTVFVGGAFDTISGQSRDCIAALDATTGNVLAWNPIPCSNGGVNALAVSGTMVYAGGNFTSISMQSRNYIAAFDATTGNVLPWDPNANSILNPLANYGIFSLAVNGTTVYAGGSFTSIGGQSRNNIAALDATTGNALPWNPDASNPELISTVYSLAVSGTTVYAGGNFSRIGGQIRYYIAALDATTGNALAWNPNAEGSCVYSLAVSGTTVYAGGSFGNIGGQSRNYIAALDATTGNATPWNPNAVAAAIGGGYDPICIYSLVVHGTTVYAVGAFDTIGGLGRKYIAALDAITGNATAWTPNPNGIVHSLAVSGTTVYAGGSFTSIGGQSRNNIAALDASTGNALGWNPQADSPVLSLAVNGSTVYAGGDFRNIGQGVSHSNFAQFDSSYNSPVIQPISASLGAKTADLQIIGSNLRSGAFVKFAYALLKPEHVSLRLYSLNGQMQSELVNKHQDAGNYSLSMQRSQLAAGAYLVVFKAGDIHQEKMISLMK